jgi:hypothetical protein
MVRDHVARKPVPILALGEQLAFELGAHPRDTPAQVEDRVAIREHQGVGEERRLFAHRGIVHRATVRCEGRRARDGTGARGRRGGESPDAAPGRSISGSYPQPASTIAADNASTTGPVDAPLEHTVRRRAGLCPVRLLSRRDA